MKKTNNQRLFIFKCQSPLTQTEKCVQKGRVEFVLGDPYDVLKAKLFLKRPGNMVVDIKKQISGKPDVRKLKLHGK